jgi:hypothetical protein
MHPWGPLSPWSTRVLRLPTVSFNVVNTSATTPAAVRLTLEPLVSEREGAVLDARLTLWRDGALLLPEGQTVAVDVPPGTALGLQLCGEGKLPPQRYVSRLRVHTTAANGGLQIPVTVRVAAHWAWAFGLLLVGLLFLGLLTLLAGAGDVREAQARVLAAQQALHEFLDRSPPAEAYRALADEIDDGYAAALKILNQPRGWSVRDRRLPLADERLQRAQRQLEQLRKDETANMMAHTEVADLTRAWQAVLAHTRQVQAQLQGREQAFKQRDEWARLLGDFLQAERQLFLDPVLQATEMQLGPHVERVHLILASGEAQRAQTLGRQVMSWVRRAGRPLEERIRLLLAWHAFAQEMEGRYRQLSSAVHDQRLPVPLRRAIGASLTAARTALETNPSLLGFKEAHAQLEQATTLALQAVSAVVVDDVKAALHAAAAATSTEEVEAAMARLTPGDPPEVKQRNLLGILALWEERIDTCQDPSLKNQLRQKLAELRALVTSGELASVGAEYTQLVRLWQQYQQTHSAAAGRRVVKTYCTYLGAELDKQLQASEQPLRLWEPHEALKGLHEKLDQIRLRRQRVPEGDCLNQVIALHGEAVAASEQLFTTLISLQDISPEARLAAAEHAGVQAAVELARRLMTDPWPLRLAVRSAAHELQVGRQVTLEVADLHPGWGTGVTVAIDFGDDSTPTYKTAEGLRADPLLAHRYEQAKRFTVRAIAAYRFQEGTVTPEGDVLGQGEVSVEIAPSPISAARALADTFLNLRFFLALAVGLAIQSWRFYTAQPFGAQSKDYAEAITWGLGIDAGVRGLVEFLSKVGLPS